jgi:hypothetical protein
MAVKLAFLGFRLIKFMLNKPNNTGNVLVSLHFAKALFISGPGESRTPNLLIRSQMLYPVKLRDLFYIK